MRLCALYSGGKDSTFAIHWAVLHGFEVAYTLTLIPRRPDSWMFQVPNVAWAPVASEAMGIDSLTFFTSGEKDKELEDLKKALSKCKELGVSGVLAGALLSDYQRLNIAIVAEGLDLKTYTPLWRKDQEVYMRELVEEGFEILITSASAYGFPFELVGKTLDKDGVKRVIEASRRYGFNPAFEGGEAETFVLYAPLYKRRLQAEGETIRKGEYEWVFRIRRIH